MRSGSKGLRASNWRLMSALREGKKASGKSRVRTSGPSAPARNSAALPRASLARSALAPKTTQQTAALGCSARSRSTEPPHPISMSSLWAPRKSRRGGRSPGKAGAKVSIGLGAGGRGGGAVPDLPDGAPLAVHRLEHLLVLERVHARPEAAVLVRHELVLADQPRERLEHEFLALVQMVEDRLLEDEVPP